MSRFKMFVHMQVEVFASDKFEAFDIVRDFADAIEEGDGLYLQDLSEQYFPRVRVTYDSSQVHELANTAKVVKSALKRPLDSPVEPEFAAAALPENGGGFTRSV